MTPKEKAEEIWDRFLDLDIGSYDAKSCALICVDEILESLKYNDWQNIDYINYYHYVKQEIIKQNEEKTKR